MEELVGMRCVACRGDEPQATDQEINKLLPLIPEWHVAVREGEKRLERAFKFKNFAEALAFTDKIGAIAEFEGHHPAILTEWGKVTVAWWTHKIKGLHRNDFIMAAKTDQALKEMSATKTM
jgi:4a-hydroxytetrahydrobiopterin dehydratase